MAAESNNPLSYFKSIILAPIQHKKIFIFVALLVLFYTFTGQHLKNNQFDYFVFSQRWLPSACIEYIEQNSRSDNPHQCILPNNYMIWTIHGLWPTRIDKMGPFFCNNSMPLDLEKLRPIESSLKLTWPNIENGKSVDSLWRHEWSKHGTCATQLESLNSEFKYFNVTLNFFKTYDLQNLFRKNNFRPNNFIAVSDLIHVINNTFRKLPQIHCIREVKSNQAYLSEIHLCYNKNLELMDCLNVHNTYFNGGSKTNSLTNCPFDEKILLPNSVSPQSNQKFLLKNSGQKDYFEDYLDLLDLIKFLQWVSI